MELSSTNYKSEVEAVEHARKLADYYGERVDLHFTHSTLNIEPTLSGWTKKMEDKFMEVFLND